MSKKNLLLGVILGVLLILVFIYKGPFRDWKNDLGKPDNFLSEIDVDSINKIEIKNHGDDVVIDKIGDKWKIAGTKDFYVKENIINEVTSSLNDAKDSDFILVSENKDKKSEFMTDKENGCSVKLKNGGDIIVEFVIGKSGNEFNSAYLAKDGNDSTYLVKASLNKAFVHNNWYDKDILLLDADKVSKIRFQYPSREFTVEKSSKEDDRDGKWSGVLPYRFSVNQEKIEAVLDIMSNMTAVDIPAQTFEGTGLEKNNIIIQVTGEDIDDIIMIGDNNGQDEYYAKRGDSDNIYLIAKDERDGLEKRIADLR